MSSVDKTLSRNRHRIWSPTYRRATKEESKVANLDWVDHHACNLLQYTNVKANLFIMGTYFNELRWKIVRANNLLQFIYQVTKKFRSRKSLMQERFKSNLEFKYQIIIKLHLKYVTLLLNWFLGVHPFMKLRKTKCLSYGYIFNNKFIIYN